MKGLTSMGLKENGKRKMDSACRMFLLNSVKHKKIGNAYINERGQFIHLSVSTVKLFSISPVCELTWLAHVQCLFKQPTYTRMPHPQTHAHTHTHEGACAH